MQTPSQRFVPQLIHPLILEEHSHAARGSFFIVLVLDNFTNSFPPLIHTLLDQVTWLCNGDFVKESERKISKLEPMEGANKWRASLVITVCVFWGGL